MITSIFILFRTIPRFFLFCFVLFCFVFFNLWFFLFLFFFLIYDFFFSIDWNFLISLSFFSFSFFPFTPLLLSFWQKIKKGGETESPVGETQVVRRRLSVPKTQNSSGFSFLFFLSSFFFFSVPFFKIK